MKLLDQIRNRLQSFVNQRDDVAMLLESPAGDATPLLKILESVEESSDSHLFWVFTDNFTDATTYACDIVKAFASKHELVRMAMHQQNMLTWPPIPPSILSESAAPVERLRELAVFSRDLLPLRDTGNNIWIYFPLEIADQNAFWALMADLIRHEFPFPWCHHLRFMIRVAPNGSPQPLTSYPRVQHYQPDLSADTINRAFEDEVADESLPLEQRMAPLPILAGNDFGQSRYPEAMEKYQLLLRYHASIGNYAMAAFALNGMGEVYERLGDLERANQSYESALIPASYGEYPSISIFLNVVLNLANLCVLQSRWEDGEAYYDLAQQLAVAARNAPAKISSLEKLGYCQHQQGKEAEAAETWHNGTVIAAQLEDVDSCRSLLGRLEQHYTRTGDAGQARLLQEQLQALAS
jgi:tetratricopeptide (TPR) repeat protein